MPETQRNFSEESFHRKDSSTIDVDHLQAILKEQARIALVNYDAAQRNHESILKLMAIITEQSKAIDGLIATVGDLLETMALKGDD